MPSCESKEGRTLGSAMGFSVCFCVGVNVDVHIEDLMFNRICGWGQILSHQTGLMDQTKEGRMKRDKGQFLFLGLQIQQRAHRMTWTEFNEHMGKIWGFQSSVRSQGCGCDVETKKLMLSGCINRDIGYRTEEVIRLLSVLNCPHLECGIYS